MSYQHELTVASQLALEAGHLLMTLRHTALDVQLKGEDDPVTQADIAASALIVEGLNRAFPDDVVISEEAPDDPQRLEHPRVWFIDPLDGTKDFIAGEPGFCVMIGLAVRHRPTLGVIYQPVTGRLYSAASGHAATVTHHDLTLRLQVATGKDIRMVVSRTHRSDRLNRLKAALGVKDEQRIGSVGVKVGLIAMGERDLYINPSAKTKAWDTCAPEAILTGAGGRLTDFKGHPLHYGQPDLANPKGLIASNGIIHERVLAAIQDVLRADPHERT